VKLRDEESERLEQLQETVEELLGQITPELMQRVYRHWIERLDQVRRTNGDYI
jgi:inactivated superfamily I helicase